MEVARLDCPHCKRKLISRTSAWRYTLDPPLRTCPYCNGEYLMPCTYEWSIAGPLGKFFYVFLANGRWAFPALSLSCISTKDTREALLWAIAWITISLLRLAIFDRKKSKTPINAQKTTPIISKNYPIWGMPASLIVWIPTTSSSSPPE